jgi:oligoendopeptidase F
MKTTENSKSEWLQPFKENLEVFFDEFMQTESTISPQINRLGESSWHVLDPRTRKLIEFNTESEMLSWLDRNASN